MATISFLAGESFSIYDVIASGGGLGFYGSAGFAASVPVGEYQSNTFITNAAGTQLGPQCDNIKWAHPNSGYVNTAGSPTNLRSIPNYQSTLGIRVTNSTTISTQNNKVRIWDRSNINNPASGVVCKTAELIHPGLTQTADGSGDTSWQTPTGSSVIHSLVNSPGPSGFFPAGPAQTQHDHYLAISAQPTDIGAKSQFGLLFSTEYL